MGWSGDVVVLGKLPVPGILLILIKVGQGPTVLAVCAGGGCKDFFFSLVYRFSPFLPFSGRRYRLKNCFEGPYCPKQLTNQPSLREGERKEKR